MPRNRIPLRQSSVPVVEGSSTGRAEYRRLDGRYLDPPAISDARAITTHIGPLEHDGMTTRFTNHDLTTYETV